MDKHNQWREKKVCSDEGLMIRKQDIQMKAMAKKLDISVQEDTIVRNEEEKKMMKRYQNVKREMESW